MFIITRDNVIRCFKTKRRAIHWSACICGLHVPLNVDRTACVVRSSCSACTHDKLSDKNEARRTQISVVAVGDRTNCTAADGTTRRRVRRRAPRTPVAPMQIWHTDDAQTAWVVSNWNVIRDERTRHAVRKHYADDDVTRAGLMCIHGYGECGFNDAWFVNIRSHALSKHCSSSINFLE